MNPDKNNILERHGIQICDGRKVRNAFAEIIREVPLDLFLNGEKIITIACAGIHRSELAVGFLRSEGMIGTRSDLKEVREMDGEKPSVHVTASVPERPAAVTILLSSGARGQETMPGPGPVPPPAAGLSLSPAKIFTLMDQLTAASDLHEATHGTHCSGLADRSGMIVTREDIGRHNTLDMLGGHMLLKDMTGSDKILVTTGRVSSEIAAKTHRMGIPMIVSHSAPTSRAITLCRSQGITLVGYVRGGTFRVYAHGERVDLEAMER